VPPLTLGPPVVGALRERVGEAGGMLDVHLMIERPERQVAEFARAGADSITFHAEATPHAAYAASLIREHGLGVGVAINPGTPVELLLELLPSIDLVLCMTVNPGWGGQPFIEGSPAKIARLRELLESGRAGAGAEPGSAEARAGSRVAIEVDGGINPDTAPVCRGAGANIFVAGSAIFGAPDPAGAYRALADSIAAE
jgi:ribulose-phosphate 3-epimerase